MSVADIRFLTCDQEPIHIPGSIQAHGYLIALNPIDKNIVSISDNFRAFLNQDPRSFVDAKISEVLPNGLVRILEDMLSADSQSPSRAHSWNTENDQHFNILLHFSGELAVFELEKLEQISDVKFVDFYDLVRGSSYRLQNTLDITKTCEMVANDIRDLTGYDRVMIYRFEENWDGLVIAEARSSHADSYLGLRFPASDIPAQARELYTKNWIRAIPNVAYQPSPLLASSKLSAPLDLSFAHLRSVSPLHLEYLQNMNVASSMSVSILKNNRLWGLIACHHEKPLYLSYQTRLACEFLGQQLSLQTVVKENLEDYAYKLQIKNRLFDLSQSISSLGTVQGLSQSDQLRSLISCGGVAFLLGNTYASHGRVPPKDVVYQIAEFLRAQSEREPIFATDSLATLENKFTKCADSASGVATIILDASKLDLILYFRPEQREEVSWAGNPHKIETQDPSNIPQLHPRKSFRIWTETVRYKSTSWKSYELEALSNLRLELIESRHKEAMQALNKVLKQSNDELESFAYIASHDLKEPLRGIKIYAQLSAQGDSSALSDTTKEYLSNIISEADRMEERLRGLLHYSKIGTVQESLQTTSVQEVVESVLKSMKPIFDEQNAHVSIVRNLPTITCESYRIYELFQNLLTNSLKYNDKPQKRIEIGCLEGEELKSIPGASPGVMAASYVFYVRDNGIGIDAKHYPLIFRIYKRLHSSQAFGGGTGLGLTLVKKIVEKHKGTIWIDSTLGEQTTFYFTLEGQSHGDN